MSHVEGQPVNIAYLICFFSDRERHSAGSIVFEEHSVVGFNYRMTDIQAAVGREQLRRLPGIVAERRRLARTYRTMLAGVPGVGLPEEPEWARSNWQSFVVSLPEGCDQRQVMQAMLDSGVSTRRGIMCAHREAPYAGLHHLTVSEWAQDRHIILPLYPGLTDDEATQVVDSLRSAVSTA